MRAATVAVEPSGDSGCAWSRIAASRTLSSAAIASMAERIVATASSRACPTGVSRATFSRSTARFIVPLQRLHVRHVDVIDVDAVLGE